MTDGVIKLVPRSKSSCNERLADMLKQLLERVEKGEVHSFAGTYIDSDDLGYVNYFIPDHSNGFDLIGHVSRLEYRMHRESERDYNKEEDK
jgi:hypothetical protein